MLSEKTPFFGTLQQETGYQQPPDSYTNDLALTKANSLFFKYSEVSENLSQAEQL